MGRRAEQTDAYEAERHSSVWGWVAAGVLLIAVCQPLLSAEASVSAYVRRVVILAGINITLAVSLNLINGVTGQFSIGHGGFMAIGAYVASAVTVFGGTALERAAAGGALDPAQPVLNLFLVDTGGPLGAGVVLRAQAWFVCSLLVGGLAAALAGIVVGLPTLRLRGDYLAIATLGFGEIIKVILLNTDALGGASGFTGRAPFYKIPAYTNFANVYLTALVCILAVTTLKRSTHGRALLAVREDEIAAEAVGIDTTRYKVLAFAVSALFAGLAGGLLAHLQGSIIPRMFDFMRSIEVITMVVLGGSGSTTGCVLAATVLTVLPERLRELGEWRMILYAEILVVMMLVRRQGLLGSRELASRDWRNLGLFLRTRGLRGVAAVARGWVAGVVARCWARLDVPGRPRWAAWMAGLVLLVPYLDLVLWALLPPAAGPRGTYAAEVTSALSGLGPSLLAVLPQLKGLVTELHLPLHAGAGLSIALLPALLLWHEIAWGLAAGRRSAGWLIIGVGLLGCWHGGGLLAVGDASPRRVVELAGALLVLAVGAISMVAERRWRRERP